MTLLKAAALALGLLPVAAMASHANATTATFDWAITAYGTPAQGYLAATESGQLTATEQSGGAWLITSVSLAGSSTNVLASGGDDLVFPQANANITSLDTLGFAFTSSDYGVVHIFDDYGPGHAYTNPPASGGINPYGETSSAGYGQGNFTLTPQVSAAPEPAAWALMLAGVGGAGLMLRRSKKTVQGAAVSA